MSYLIETHYHTCISSSCGSVEPKTGLKIYKENGYSGVVITDHFCKGNLERFGETYLERVKRYLQSYEEAKKYETENFKVFLGFEIRFEENYNDYLLYGPTVEDITNEPDLYMKGINYVSNLAREKGWYFGQAHPFRSGSVPCDPKCIMGVEIFNGHPDHENHNDKALKFAKENGLIFTSGSDFHRINHACTSGMFFDTMPKTSKELAQFIIAGKGKLKRY